MLEGLSLTSFMIWALAMVRIASAFLLLPAFAPETISPLVRNSIFLVFSLVALALHAEPSMPLSPPSWVGLFAKEVFVGLIMGFFMGSVLWAFEVAGQLIDMKVGLGMASIIDPLTGHQTSPTGGFLARLVNFLFMASGGFLLFVGLLFESYLLWPVTEPLPDLKAAGVGLIEAEMGGLMQLGLLIAAPALLISLTADLALGLVNRFAPQFNVFSFSQSLKALLSGFVLLLMLGGLVQLFLDDLPERLGRLSDLFTSLTAGRDQGP